MASNPIQFVETKYGRLAYRMDGSVGDVPLVLLQRFRGTTMTGTRPLSRLWPPAAVSSDLTVLALDDPREERLKAYLRWQRLRSPF